MDAARGLAGELDVHVYVPVNGGVNGVLVTGEPFGMASGRRRQEGR